MIKAVKGRAAMRRPKMIFISFSFTRISAEKQIKYHDSRQMDHENAPVRKTYENGPLPHALATKLPAKGGKDK